MEAFVPENWEIIEQRGMSEDFIPMQVEVFKHEEPQFEEGLIDKRFDTPIKHQGGPRSHRSTDEILKEQERRLFEEQENANKIYFTQEQIDAMLEKAYQKGKEESAEHEAGEYQQRLANIEQKLTTVVQDLVQQESEKTAELEDMALQLSLQISKKIIEEAVEINPEYILQVLQESLKLSGTSRIKKVRVSPQDLEFIRIFKIAESIKEFDGTWEFEADESIKAGCILENSAGTIDFQLDQAWERIKDKVLSLRK